MKYQDLNTHPLKRFLTPEEVCVIDATAECLSYESGDKIISINSRNRDIMCLDRGSASVQIESIDGENIEVATLSAGSLLGEMNFVVPTRRTANVLAKCQLQVTVYPYRSLTELLRQNPIIAAKVFAAINLSMAHKYIGMSS
jgi:CRP-like cAMP-binding protein